MNNGLMNITPFYMSVLKNDIGVTYVKRFHCTYADMQLTELRYNLGNSSEVAYKLMIATKSLNNNVDVTYFDAKIEGATTTQLDRLHIDLSNGVGVIEQNVEITPNSTLVLTHETFSTSDYQTRIVNNEIEFDVLLFCKPIMLNKNIVIGKINEMDVAYFEKLTVLEIEE